MTASRHLIGLLLGTEEDWPKAFEEILRRLGPVEGPGRTKHSFDTERLTIASLVLCDAFRHPALLARQAVALDHASGGRYELGPSVGRGATSQGAELWITMIRA